MSNKGWKKMMRSVHAHSFECPVCDHLFKYHEEDIILEPINPQLTITFGNAFYKLSCQKCGAISHLSEGEKNYAY